MDGKAIDRLTDQKHDKYPELVTSDRVHYVVLACEEGGRWGPGVFAMKAGIAYFVFACEALRELEVPVARRFVLQLNSDEEIGSPASRRYTKAEAKGKGEGGGEQRCADRRIHSGDARAAARCARHCRWDQGQLRDQLQARRRQSTLRNARGAGCGVEFRAFES